MYRLAIPAIVLFMTATLLAQTHLTWLHQSDSFQANGQSSGIAFASDDGDMILDNNLHIVNGENHRQGVYRSDIFSATDVTHMGFAGWICSEQYGHTNVQLQLRSSSQSFADDADLPQWESVTNGQVAGLPQGQYFQYKIILTRSTLCIIVGTQLSIGLPEEQQLGLTGVT